jgi:FkbM family methyltransferase
MQVFLPALQNARFAVQRCSQRLGRSLFEPDIAALQMFAWPDEPVFADIGVNRGLTTDAMRLLVPDARIIGFEPNPLLFEQLTSLYADAPGVDLHAIALGRRSLDGILYVPVYRNWLFDGLGSLKRNEAAEWLSADTLYFFDERHLRLREYPCRVRRLDELDLAPSFIKIDVQGHEYEVLCGAEQTLRRHQPAARQRTWPVRDTGGGRWGRP